MEILDREWLSTVPDRPFELARSWLVVASAGCGKTYALRKTISDLLAGGTKPEEILFIMFNKRPADEFKSYFPQLSKEQTQWWGTHHAVCRKLLFEHGFYFTPMGDLSSRWWKKFMSDYHYNFLKGGRDEDLKTSVDRKQYDLSPVFAPDELRYLSRLNEFELLHKVKAHGTYMRECLLLNYFPKGIKYFFVDEAQDNGDTQHKWIADNSESLLGIMIAGDDKQAINAFKGGTYKPFLETKADRYVSLPLSFRCGNTILTAANKIIRHVKDRSPLVEKNAYGAEGKVSHVDKREVFRLMIDECKKGNSALVLARTNTIRDKKIKKIAFDYNIPILTAETEGIKRVFLTIKQIKELGGFTFADIEALRPGSLLKTSYWPRGWWKKYDEENEERRELNQSQFSFLKNYEENEFLTIDECTRLGFLPSFIEDVARGFPLPERFGKDSSIAVSVKQNLERFGSDYKGIRPMTIHHSKGLEAETVFVFTDIPRIIRDAERCDPDEERRVWYVAFTRAKSRLIVSSLGHSVSRVI